MKYCLLLSSPSESYLVCGVSAVQYYTTREGVPFKSKEVYITINISVAIISIQRACLMTTSVILLAVLLMSINMKKAIPSLVEQIKNRSWL